MTRILVVFDMQRNLDAFRWELGHYAFQHSLDVRGSGRQVGVGGFDYTLVMLPDLPGRIPWQARGVQWDEVWTIGVDPGLAPLGRAVAGFNQARLVSAPRLIPPGESMDMREEYRRGESPDDYSRGDCSREDEAGHEVGIPTDADHS